MLSLNLLRVHHSADYIGQLAMKNFKTSNTFLQDNHNYNKIVKSDWLSTALISALIGQFNRTVRAITRALKWLFFVTASKTKFRISCVLI